jgi:putative glycerol-1-phosphate prenyltransferase
MKVYPSFINKTSKKLAVLIDPDKVNSKNLTETVTVAQNSSADYIFVGGSLLTNNNLGYCIKIIKENCSIPVVLFPGNTMQINDKADAILFLSLISGRNAEMLIGKHVIAAPYLKKSLLEIIPTGYMLIDSGKSTSVSYMSNSIPIPADKEDIALCTAMAGEMLGLKLIYMDGGSGADKPIKESMISNVKQNISVPLIIGGGIKTPKIAVEICKAGADIIVVGSAVEKNISLLPAISDAVHIL